MKLGFGILICVVSTTVSGVVDISAPCNVPVSVVKCHIDDDHVQDEIRVYHCQKKSPEGDFKSVALFLEKKKKFVPVYLFEWSGPFPNMMSVAPCGVDDERDSSLLLLQLHSAGASHSYLELRIAKLVEKDDKMDLEVRFRHFVQDAGSDDIRLNGMGPKGHYRLSVGNESFHLVNGYDAKESEKKKAPYKDLDSDVVNRTRSVPG